MLISWLICQWTIAQKITIPSENRIIADQSLQNKLPNRWTFTQPTIIEPNGIKQELTGKCKTWKCLEKQLVAYLESWGNNGYVHAKLKLDSVFITSTTKDTLINTVWTVDTGFFFIYDTIRHFKPLPVNRRVLERYLGIRYGKPVRYRNLKAIYGKLIALPQVKIDSISSEAYQWGRANWIAIRLTLSENITSNLQGALSFSQQPNGRLILTGFALLDFKNLFKRLIELNLRWNGMANGQQNLEFKCDVPFIINSFGWAGFLNLYRQDTSFVKVRYRLGFLWSGNITVNPFIERYYVLPAFDTTVQTVSTFMGGLRMKIYRSDNPYFPFRGYNGELAYSGGNRETQLSTGILHSIEGNVSVSMPIRRTIVLFLRLNGQALLGDNITDEESYPVGGTNSIIGMPDGEIRAVQWASSFISVRRHWQDLIAGIFTQPAYLSGRQPTKGIISGGLETHFLLEKSYISLVWAVSSYPTQATFLQRIYVHISYGIWNR